MIFLYVLCYFSCTCSYKANFALQDIFSSNLKFSQEQLLNYFQFQTREYGEHANFFEIIFTIFCRMFAIYQNFTVIFEGRIIKCI
jgi:hypothetical protein